MPLPPRRRRLLIALAAVLACLAVVAAVTVLVFGRHDGVRTGFVAGDRTRTIGRVTAAGGGTVALDDGTVVTIPPGGISADAVLTLRHDPGAAPAVPAGVRPLGSPVRITLSGDARLTAPATLTLPVAAARPAGWPAGTPVTAWPAYFDEPTGTWVAQPGQYDAARGVVTARVDHFSWWNPFTWDYGAIADEVGQALADLVGAPSGQPPTCASPPPGGQSSGGEASPGGSASGDGAGVAGADGQIHVVVEGASLLDWCLGSDGGQTVLRTRGLRDYPLLVSWSGNADLVRRTEYEADLVSAYRWLSDRLGLDGADAVTIPAGGAVDLAVSPDAGAPVYVTATWDPQVQLVGIVDATARVVMALRGALGITTTTEQVVQATLDGQCLGQHVDDLADDPAGATVTILTSCVSDVVRELTKDAGRGLLRFFGAVPAVVGALLGTVGYAINQFFVSLGTAGHDLLAAATGTKLTLYVGSSPPPGGPAGDGSGWPVHDNEGPPAFFAWLGANFFAVPDFTSCTDDGRWCIGGFGDEVHIFDIDKLRDAGSVPASAADPKAALLAKGLPEQIVDELLRPG